MVASNLFRRWIPQWLLDFFMNHGVVRIVETLITFDDVPDGTMINTHYLDKGVTFSSVSSLSGNAYASKWIDNNVITLHDPTQACEAPAFSADQGMVKAAFSDPKQKVSIDARGVEALEILGSSDLRPFIQAFDAENNMLSKVYYPYKYGVDQGWSTWQKLTIERPTADISYVLFSSDNNPAGVSWAYGGIYGLFDNLQFS